MPLPHRLPDRLPSPDVLSLVARTGAVTPELLAAVVARCRLRDLSTGDVCQMDRTLVSLLRRGLLHRDIIRTSLKALRSAERTVYKLTKDGEALVASASGDMLDEAIALAVRNHVMPGTGGWACLFDIWEEALPGWSHQRNVRHRVRRLVEADLLEEMETRPPRHLALLRVTDAGLALIRNEERTSRRPAINSTRPPRLDQAVHHLLVLLAAAQLADTRDLAVHSVWGDEELRSRTRRGREATPGSRFPALPDGRVTFVDEEGGRTEAAIEVIVSGYTDPQIRNKYDALPATTVYAVVSRNLADRIVGLGLPRPLLVS